MKFVNMKLYVLVPFIVVTLVSLGCSTLDPESQSVHGATEAENVIEIECGARTFEAQIDNLTPEQEEQLEEFKTRCRIDNVANQIELRHNLGDADRANPINIRPNPTNSGLPPDVGR